MPPDAVNPKRAYNSPRRQEQAAATRRQILDAARRLFVRQGYAATTMAQIAAEAGVALKTVYLAFDTKSGLLQKLWNVTLRGDDGEVPVAEQAWYREMMDEPDPERQLRLNARNSRMGKERVAPVGEVIRSGAAADPEIAALWARIQSQFHENQRTVVESLAGKKALALDADRATDLLWLINHPNTWLLLVGERGWTGDEYEQWAADTARRELLGGGDA
jgi:AcrR family transcriptional regulator